MSKHTPGPWNLERPEHDLIRMVGKPGIIRARGTASGFAEQCPDIQIWASSGNGFYHGVALLPMAEGDPVDEANAHLIAAAPDLLAALRSVLEYLPDENDALNYAAMNDGQVGRVHIAARAARAAIAKATKGNGGS